jgi:hypothetical protein
MVIIIKELLETGDNYTVVSFDDDVSLSPLNIQLAWMSIPCPRPESYGDVG